jgi:hypothetical protein
VRMPHAQGDASGVVVSNSEPALGACGGVSEAAVESSHDLEDAASGK